MTDTKTTTAGSLDQFLARLDEPSVAVYVDVDVRILWFTIKRRVRVQSARTEAVGFLEGGVILTSSAA